MYTLNMSQTTLRTTFLAYMWVHWKHLLQTCQLLSKEMDDDCTEDKAGKYCK